MADNIWTADDATVLKSLLGCAEKASGHPVHHEWMQSDGRTILRIDRHGAGPWALASRVLNARSLILRAMLLSIAKEAQVCPSVWVTLSGRQGRESTCRSPVRSASRRGSTSRAWLRRRRHHEPATHYGLLSRRHRGGPLRTLRASHRRHGVGRHCPRRPPRTLGCPVRTRRVPRLARDSGGVCRGIGARAVRVVRAI